MTIPESAGAHKKNNLISVAELARLLQDAEPDSPVKLIDASWYAPADDAEEEGPETSPLHDYMKERIPGAVFFDHDQISDFNSPLPQATPTAQRFATCVGELGVSRTDRVVVYEGSAGYESAPRAWFLFKLYGHPDVKVLEGGLPAWLEEGYEVERGQPSAPPKPAVYEGAAEEPGMQIDVSQVVDNLRLQRVQVVDCRRPSFFSGEKKESLFNVVNEGRVKYGDHREGHVPGAKNVPFEGLVQQQRRKSMSSNNLSALGPSGSGTNLTALGRQSGSGTNLAALGRQSARILLPAASMEETFRRAQVDPRQSMAVVCATGRTSAAMLLSLRNIGADARLVKDGMAAWSTARGKSLPMVRAQPSAPTTERPTGEGSDEEKSEEGEPREADGVKRVILWAVTRSRSTAFERAVSMRRDAVAMHELLTEPYLLEYNSDNYVKVKAGQEREHVQTSSVGYQAVQEVMLADYSLQGRPFFFSKELACYFHPEAISDEWLLQFKHVLLVRDPQASLASFYRVSETDAPTTYYDPSEAGFKECFAIFQRVTSLGGDVLVLDADEELMADPEATLRHFCTFAEVDFDPAMLSWTPQELPDWRKFRGWHDDVCASSGFAPVSRSPKELPPEVTFAAAGCAPYYTAVRWQTNKHSEQWPALAQIGAAEASVLCVAGPSDLLPKLLAARLAEAHISSYVLDPMELGSARQQFGFIFDTPIAVVCAAEIAPQVAKELQPYRLRGEICVLRLIVIATTPAAELAPQLAHLGMPHTVVSTAELLVEPAIHRRPPATAADTLPPPPTGRDALAALAALLVNDLAEARTKTTGALEEYIATKSVRPEPLRSWRSLFREALAAAPSAAAVVDEDMSLSMRDLHERASLVARVLRERGCAGGTVCIYMERNAACCVVAIGALMVRTKFVDVAAWNKPNDLVRILGVVKPDLVVTSRALTANLETARAEVDVPPPLVVEDLPSPGGAPPLEPLADDPEDDPARSAFSVLTSGSTSVSKIVLCPQAALTDAMPYFREALQPGDRVGLFWIYYYFLCPLLFGCTTVIIPDRAFLDPKLFLDCVKRQRLAAVYITPSILELCVKNASVEAFADAFASVRCIWLTGEKLRDETREAVRERAPHVKVQNVYSTNESGDLAIAHSGGGSIELLPYIQPKVLNSAGNIVPRGAVGTLHVLADACFNGYLATGGSVVRQRHEYYNTGDLVRWLGGGRIAFVARQKGAHIKVRGYKVFPDLIEGVLGSHPSVGYVWVAGIGSTDENTQLEAAIHLKPGAPEIEDEAGLRDWLQKRLPHYMIPLRFHRLAEPPISMAGKAKGNATLRFAELPPLCTPKDDVETLTPHLETIASIWRKALQLPLPGLHVRAQPRPPRSPFPPPSSPLHAL